MNQSDVKLLSIYLGVDPLYAGYVSGGELHHIELLKRYPFKCALVTSKTGEEILRLHGINADFHIVSVSIEGVLRNSKFGLIILFLLRMIKSIPVVLRLQKTYRIVCASSHFICDVFPAVVAHIRQTSSVLVIYIHHLEPPPLVRARYHPLFPSLLAWFSQVIVLKLLRGFAPLLFTNPRDAELLARKFPGLVETMHQGLDLSAIEKIEPCQDRFDACFLGRLDPLKGIFDMVEIWEIVIHEFPDAKLAVIGSLDEAYVPKLRKTIESKGLKKNVLLLGTLPSTKYAVMKSSNVFVFPSYEEGWGIAIWEALACGLPVVAYKLPAYKVLGNTIIQVPVGDKKAFAIEVTKLIRNSEYREEMAKVGIKLVADFTWDKVLSEELEHMALIS